MEKIINTKEDIYINLALFVNKLMLDDNIIGDSLYREIQDVLLKKISYRRDI